MSKITSFFPIYDFSPTVNAAYLKEILPMMMRHSIPANPINYAICYGYMADNNPHLTQALDNALDEQKTLDCDTSLELYRKHVCNISLELFEQINHKIHKVIAQASVAINDTCHQAEATNDSFLKKTSLLENTAETSTIQSILQEIISETHALADTTQVMQDKLSEAQREMEQLRVELAQVRQIAVTDGLTGLLNRRAFDETLAEIIEQSTVSSTCLSMLDIDHFKRVNDTFGHTIGDNVIKYVASLLKKHTEQHHHVARYGGEELAIIMPNTSQEKALEIAEKIRHGMESSQLKRKDTSQPLGKITLSIGVAQLEKGDDAECLIIRADRALYQAKESGRNKVIQAS